MILRPNICSLVFFSKVLFVFVGSFYGVNVSSDIGPQGQVYHWSSHAYLANVSVSLTALEDDEETNYVEDTTTDVSGEYAFSSPDGDASRITLSKQIDAVDAGSVISSADALAALKIAVGINPNPDPDGSGPLLAPAVSPYQFISADVNQDARIT